MYSVGLAVLALLLSFPPFGSMKTTAR